MPWERELEVLEEAIRRLAGEYDAFLYGTASKPPLESRRHVELMIRRLSGVSFDAAAEGYRFATLQGRYTSLGERWERLQAEKESGKRPGLHGHFAPETEPAARREAPAVPPPSPPPDAPAARSVDTEKEGTPADRRLFDSYLEARRAQGESVEGYAFEKFAESLDRERARMKERLGTEDVVFEVALRDGKVKLVAKRGEREAGAKR
ncbi:MAG: MXAN_5187 C-terminal domain-containing protein [Thermoanaerobaculia bacterium]